MLFPRVDAVGGLVGGLALAQLNSPLDSVGCHRLHEVDRLSNLFLMHGVDREQDGEVLAVRQLFLKTFDIMDYFEVFLKVMTVVVVSGRAQSVLLITMVVLVAFNKRGGIEVVRDD